MGRGITSPISAAIVGFAIMALAIYTTYVTVNTVTQIYTLSRGGQRGGCGYIRIVNSTLYQNNTLRIFIENEGPDAIEGINELDMALVLHVNGSQYTYSLRYCGSPASGCWVAKGVAVGSRVYGVYGKRAIRPGEILFVEAYPQAHLKAMDYGYIVVFTGCSKAERVIILDSR